MPAYISTRISLFFLVKRTLRTKITCVTNNSHTSKYMMYCYLRHSVLHVPSWLVDSVPWLLRRETGTNTSTGTRVGTIRPEK